MKVPQLTCLLFFALALSGCHEESPSTSPVAAVIKLDIVSEDEAYLGGDRVALGEIEESLKTLATQLDVYLIYEVAPDTPAPIYLDVMQQIRNAGISGITSYSRQNGDEKTSMTFYKPVLNG